MSACRAGHRYSVAADAFVPDGAGGWIALFICRVCGHQLRRPAQPGETTQPKEAR